jgi:ribosome assembly protein YihI (activator of Der GTPase)
MSPSPSMEQMAADIAELKRAALQTAEILVDQSHRLDRLERSIDGRFISLEGRFESLEGRFDAVTERLDRLIAATMAERTLNAERLGAIDQRLDRLEHRLDRVEQRLP